MTRRRSIALLALAVAFVVGLVGIAAAQNPRGYVLLHPLDHPLVVWAVCWLLFAAAVTLWRPRWKAVALLAVPTLALVYLTWFSAWWETIDTHETIDRRVAADGRYELRLVAADDFIDPYWEVLVRTRRGPLSRDRVVWASGRDADQPRDMRFAGPHTIEIVAADGTVYPISI